MHLRTAWTNHTHSTFKFNLWLMTRGSVSFARNYSRIKVESVLLLFPVYGSQSVSARVKNVCVCNLCIKCSQNSISLPCEFSVHIFSFILINKTVWKNSYLCTFRKVAAENKELEVVTACAEMIVLYKNIQRACIFPGHLASVKYFQPEQEVYNSKLCGCFFVFF